MRKIFVTENVQTFADEQAETFLKTKNDLEFFNEEEQGIHKVPEERWKMAQKYERRTWMELSLSTKDDRNFDHIEKFDSFNTIKDEFSNKNSVIELGCGPFTNLRLLTDMFANSQLVLLDPLINDYISHENCSYKTGSLNGKKVSLINSTIEEFNPNNYSYEIPDKFDAVIMMNVIEHCFDVNAIFDKILQILNKDGIFIFADVYFKDVRTLVSNLYDAGHPLRLSELKMNEFLKNFKSIFDKRYHGLFGQEWRNDIYFVGEKHK